MCWTGKHWSAATNTPREMYPGSEKMCPFRRRCAAGSAPVNWRLGAKCRSSEEPSNKNECPRGRNGFAHNNKFHTYSGHWRNKPRRPFVANGYLKSEDDKCRGKVPEFCPFPEFPMLDSNHIQGFGEAVSIPWALRPSAVGLCCRMHGYPPRLTTSNEHFKVEVGKVQPEEPVPTYASAVKRPGGTTATCEAPKVEKPKNVCRSLTSLFKSAPPEAASDDRAAEVVRPQKAKPVKFSELKELVGRAEVNGMSKAVPIPKTNLAAMARRNSDLDGAGKITCLVGEIRLGKISPQLSPTNGNKNLASLSPRRSCGNALIAFIMGGGFSPPDLGGNDDESDWDEEEEESPQPFSDEPDVAPDSAPDEKSEPKGAIPEDVPDAAASGLASVENSERKKAILKDVPDFSSCKSFVGRFQQQRSDERLADVNRRWRFVYDAVLMRPSNNKVSFAEDVDLCVVHSVEPEERKGQWEELARDRCRFQRKIREVSLVIEPILDFQHRARVFENLYGNGLKEDDSSNDCDKNYEYNNK